jgi:iron(III)-enterobactin esterase
MSALLRFAGFAALLCLAAAIKSASAVDDPQEKATASAKDADAASVADGDFKIGPMYADAPELTALPSQPKAAIHEFLMDSSDSKIYPGLKGPYKRKVSVYVPNGYFPGTAMPFIVIQDAMTKDILPKILDNMIRKRRLPPIVAIFIASGGGDGKGSERGLEYDTVSETYAVFIETEVLPRIEKDYKVTFTKDPDGRATMGGSSGAACAFTMAWFRPDLYHRVLSYSGTFVDQQSPMNPQSPHGAWEYHENLIPKTDAKPLRIWLQVSERDNGYNREENTLHNWVLANERMAAALKDKKYHYRYVFSAGAGHVDRKVVRQTLPEALLWLWQGYTVK